MRAPIVAPSSFAPALACWTQMMVHELHDSAAMQKEWKADATDASQCVVLVLEPNDTLADVVQALLRAGRILPDLPNVAASRERQSA